MKVIDVLSEACALLGLSEEQNLLDELVLAKQNEGTSGEVETPAISEDSIMENEYLKKLYFLFKFSLRELCTNYLELTCKCEITSQNCKINIDNLQNFVKLQQVTKNEKLVKAKIIGNEIILPSDGKFDIIYYTYPQIESVFNDISTFGIYNSDVVVSALCAYFCLAFGRFEEFNNFHQQYLERAEGLKTLKTFNLPLRRWE